jgi:hypothetical protein
VNGPEGEGPNWDSVDWRAREAIVRRLRQRIFKATRDGAARRVAPAACLSRVQRRVARTVLRGPRRPGDDDFGPAFVKMCAYYPHPVKIWLNGHEWAKRQAIKSGIGFAELSSGFASCTDSAGLQAICDRLGPGTIGGPRNAGGRCCRCRSPIADRAAGYWWELSMRQVEVVSSVLDSLLGEETLAAERLAYGSFCFGAQVGPRAVDTFLRVAGDIVKSESA